MFGTKGDGKRNKRNKRCILYIFICVLSSVMPHPKEMHGLTAVPLLLLVLVLCVPCKKM